MSDWPEGVSRNPAIALRDYIRANFPADIIADDFGDRIAKIAAELDEPADHVREGK